MRGIVLGWVLDLLPSPLAPLPRAGEGNCSFGDELI